MFDKLRKALLGNGKDAAAETRPSQLTDPVSEWATAQGFAVAHQASPNQSLALKGKVQGKPWRIELGKPIRKYIHGEELRARAELDIDENLAVLVISRQLKDMLERQAYSMITDTLQTTADPSLPEEMRWLAMYDEVGWEKLPNPFWHRYAVLSDKREHAMAWVDPDFAAKLLDWPAPAPGPEVPFMVLLLRGKGYMRMQYEPPSMGTLQHAAAIFTTACEAALRIRG
jgi:hypothetical protein